MSWVKVKGSPVLVNLDMAREIRVQEHFNTDSDLNDEEVSHEICAVFPVLNSDIETVLFMGTEEQCELQLENLEKNL